MVQKAGLVLTVQQPGPWCWDSVPWSCRAFMCGLGSGQLSGNQTLPHSSSNLVLFPSWFTPNNDENSFRCL